LGGAAPNALRAGWRSKLAAALWSRRELLSEIAYVPAAIALSWSLLVVGGLPMTDDGMGIPFLEVYRRAYMAGDWFPIWTSFAAQGHGSPLPIMYHRLHPTVFGVLALWTGSLLALKISIPTLLTIGAAGTRRLCRLLGARPWVAWIGGGLLMSASYAVVDWFVRGATAEFTAFMLVPWCVREALRVFDDKWGPVRLAASSALLFYAHLMTFYFFVLVAGVVMLGGLLERWRFGWPGLRIAIRRGAIFTGLLTCAIGPYAAAVQYTVAFCGIDKLNMRPDNGAYFEWPQYFADPSFSWSRVDIQGAMSPEIGRWMLLCLAVVLVIAPAARAAMWKRVRGLATLGVIFVIVQRKPMSFLFEIVPGASRIQFPSRLLVYIVPITIVCTAVAVEMALRSMVPWVRAVARAMPLVSVAGQANLAMGTQSWIWGHNCAKSDVEAAMQNPIDATTGRLAIYAPETWDQFLPKGLVVTKPAPFIEASDGCTVTPPKLTHGACRVVSENMQCADVSFTVHGHECTIRMNQYRSTLLRVETAPPGEVHQDIDGSTVIHVPADGSVVHVRERSVFDLAGKWLVQKASRWP
jgi:hypothetical protein